MEMVILNSIEHGRLTLTNDTPGGEIVLSLNQDDYQEVFHPWDTLKGEDTHAPISAAFLVHSWACDPCRTENGITIARQFLRRWPEGPQAEPADLQAMEHHRRALENAALDLAVESPSLDQMSIVDRCILIRQMADKLQNFSPDSMHAYILRMRISAAASLIQADCQHEERR